MGRFRLPIVPDFGNRGSKKPLGNPLKEAIEQGKRQGFKIYAWFEYGLMLSPHDAIARQHPDWLLGGGKVVDGFVWLNPEHPEVERYFLDLLAEIATRYPDLHGIQLDDHWSVPTQFGNRSAALTKLTQKVTQKLKKMQPDWVISLSPNYPRFAYKHYSQDWLNWVVNSSGRNSLRLKPLAEVTKQIEAIESRGFGYSLFAYEYTFSFIRVAPTNTKESFFLDKN